MRDGGDDEFETWSRGRLFRYARPRSKILAERIEKEAARRAVREGRYPKGSIWCPDGGPRLDVGFLYAPDPDWRPAAPVSSFRPHDE